MIKISPSILTVDYSTIKNKIIQLEKSGIDYIHFDVMDNNFVPNLTFGSKFIKDLRPYTSIPFDIHLMIDFPEKSIEDFLKVGGDIYTIHLEATKKIEFIAKKVKQKNKLFGLSIKPNTSIKKIIPYIHLLDIILIMTVEPGFGGQVLIKNTLNKISYCKNIIKKKHLKIEIQVDGGINLENAKQVINKGSDILVIGNYFFSQKNYTLLVKKIKSLI